MCKELWCQNYDSTLEEICEEKDCDSDEAEKILEARLDEDPGYLNDYSMGMAECYEVS